MIKAVLFDLDGTLANSLKDLACSFNYALNQYGFPSHETEEFKFFVGDGIPKAIERALPEGHRDAQTVEKCRVKFFEHYRIHFADYTVPYDGIIELIMSLKTKGFRIAVVSNKAQSMADIVVGKLYPQLFDVVIGKREDTPAKPDPALIFLALSELGYSAEECLFVGDSGMDMSAAVRAGAVPVGVLWGFRPLSELARCGSKYIVKHPSEILNILENNNEL